MCPCCKSEGEEENFNDEDRLGPFQPIKNRILKEIFDNMKVGHRCHKNNSLKVYSALDLREHFKACSGMKMTCFCDPEGKHKMTMTELMKHLRKDCP